MKNKVKVKQKVKFIFSARVFILKFRGKKNKLKEPIKNRNDIKKMNT